ncbi:MAG: WD40 repeat domain-containing protein [Bacteroidota bacterium]|nr:WD40 repeat domain-containing protein [Bacteroidota bacterium]
MNKFLLSLFSTLYCFVSFAQNNDSNSVTILPGHSNDVNAAVFSSQKTKRIATAGWDNLINIYLADTPTKLVQTLTGHSASVNCLAYNLTGTMLASGGNDFRVMFWDSMYRKMLVYEPLSLKHSSNINALVFDKTGKFLFSGDNEGKLIIWDALNAKLVKSMLTGSQINDLCLSSNPANIFIASSEHNIKLFALAGNKLVRTLDGHTDAVNSIAISSNGQYLISGSNDKTARIWDLRSMKQLHVLKVDCWKVTAVAFSDDGKYCATGCNDGSVKIWETLSGTLINSIETPNCNIRDINFSKNAQQLVIAPLMRGSSEYGARIVNSRIPAPKPNIVQLKVSPAQRAVDSIMAIRILTKQDSIRYRSVFMVKPALPLQTKSTGGKTPVLDSAIIYKTPMNPKSGVKK